MKETLRKPENRKPSAPPCRAGAAVTVLLVFILFLLLAVLLVLLLRERHVPAAPEPAEPAQSTAAPKESEEEAAAPADQPQLPAMNIPVNEYDSSGFVVHESGQITYSANGLEAVAGVDVSEFQGDIDWAQVKASGMEFAMIRAGFRGYGAAGSMVMDRNFEKNLTGAREAGLKVGVYFFSQAINEEEAREEARFVLDALAGRELDYPVVFDWERITNGQTARTDGLPGQAVTQCARAFCEEVASAGYIPAVYFNQLLGYLTLDLSELAEYSFWLASYSDQPNFYYHFDMWQYSAQGHLPGIQGGVDLNLSFRDFSAE